MPQARDLAKTPEAKSLIALIDQTPEMAAFIAEVTKPADK